MPAEAALINRKQAERETAMFFETIEVRKTTPMIGAEIFGVDLSRQLSNRQFDEIHQALMENLVIFFRDQELSVEQHKAFGARFGKLHIHPNAPKGLPDHPEILVIKADESSKRVAGEAWHSGAYRRHPRGAPVNFLATSPTSRTSWPTTPELEPVK
jgi:alpha-ketoglutarate-dependent taurine dioxygenase